MKITTLSPFMMAKLGWDQSFIEDFIPPVSSNLLPPTTTLTMTVTTTTTQPTTSTTFSSPFNAASPASTSSGSIKVPAVPNNNTFRHKNDSNINSCLSPQNCHCCCCCCLLSLRSSQQQHQQINHQQQQQRSHFSIKVNCCKNTNHNNSDTNYHGNSTNENNLNNKAGESNFTCSKRSRIEQESSSRCFKINKSNNNLNNNINTNNNVNNTISNRHSINTNISDINNNDINQNCNSTTNLYQNLIFYNEYLNMYINLLTSPTTSPTTSTEKNNMETNNILEDKNLNDSRLQFLMEEVKRRKLKENDKINTYSDSSQISLTPCEHEANDKNKSDKVHNDGTNCTMFNLNTTGSHCPCNNNQSLPLYRQQQHRNSLLMDDILFDDIFLSQICERYGLVKILQDQDDSFNNEMDSDQTNHNCNTNKNCIVNYTIDNNNNNILVNNNNNLNTTNNITFHEYNNLIPKNSTSRMINTTTNNNEYENTSREHDFYKNHQTISSQTLQLQPQLRPLRQYSKQELSIIRQNLSVLLQSGFYLGRLTSEESRHLLTNKKLGTFFIRDSTNPAYILSLGVQTVRGATSIRIFFRGGVFGLETDVGAKYAHTFKSVLHLVQHYVKNPNKNVLVESSGRCDTPVLLHRPMTLTVPRLTHVVRLKVNELVGGRCVDRLPLLPSLKNYLQQYPFSI